MKLTEKEAALEAILFTMGEAVETKRLAEAIGETPEKTRELLEKLRAGWEKEHRGVNLISLEDSCRCVPGREFYDYSDPYRQSSEEIYADRHAAGNPFDHRLQAAGDPS